MSKKLILFLPLLSAAPLFLAGALRRPASEPAFSFEPQPIGLAPELAAANPDTLMNLAVDRLSPQRMPWLRVRLRQWMHSRHCGENSVTTRSPGATLLTSGPRRSTIPAPSWPRTVGA